MRTETGLDIDKADGELFEQNRYASTCQKVVELTSKFLVELTYYVISQNDDLMRDALAYFLSKPEKSFSILSRESLNYGLTGEKEKLYFKKRDKERDVKKNNALCESLLKKRLSYEKSPEARRELCYYMLTEYADTAAGIKMVLCTKPSWNNRAPGKIVDAFRKVMTGNGFIPWENLQEALDLRNTTEGHTSTANIKKFTREKCVQQLESCKTIIQRVRGNLEGETAGLEKRRCEALNEIETDRKKINCKKMTLKQLSETGLSEDEIESFIVENVKLSKDYCSDNRTLYWNTYDNVVQELLSFYKIRGDVAVKLYGPNAGESQRLKEINHPAANQPVKIKRYPWNRKLPYMADFQGGSLTPVQLDELAHKTTVLADYSFWMNRNCRQFLSDDFVSRLKRYNRSLIADWNTRLDLFEREKNKSRLYSEKDSRSARDAHNTMRMMRASNGLRYMKSSSAFVSSDFGIIQIAQSHPNVMFTVFSRNKKFTKLLIRKNVRNIIPINYIIPTKQCRVWTNFTKEVEAIFRSELENVIEKRPEQEKVKLNRQENKTVKTPLMVSEDREKKETVSLKPDQKRPSVTAKKEAFSRESSPQSSAQNPEQTAELIVATDAVQVETLKYVFTPDGQKYVLQKEIGKGGEGIVYNTNDPDRVAKIYHSKQLTEARYQKLKAMTQIKKGLPRKVCWPIALLCDDQRHFVGYLMRNASGYKEFGMSVLALNKPRIESKLMKGWDRLALVELCIEICRTFERLNRAGVLMGDVNPRNILLNCNSDSHTDFVFVDCDSYQIGRYPCPVGTVVFTSPKMYRRNHVTSGQLDYSRMFRIQEDEDYSIASLLFHILMLNQSPFSGKGVTDIATAMRENNFAYRLSGDKDNTGADTPDGPYRLIWNNMPKYIKDLFGDVFSKQIDVTMDTWIRKLIRYQKDIESGNYTAELKPVYYWDTQDHQFTEYFECDMCHQHRNMPKERYKNQEKYHQPHLCNTCMTLQKRMMTEKEKTTRICIRCGRTYYTTQWDGWMIDHDLKKPRCPDCHRERKAYFTNIDNK